MDDFVIIDGININYKLIRTHSKNISFKFEDNVLIIRGNLSKASVPQVVERNIDGIVRIYKRHLNRFLKIQDGIKVKILSNEYTIKLGNETKEMDNVIYLNNAHSREDFIKILEDHLSLYCDLMTIDYFEEIYGIDSKFILPLPKYKDVKTYLGMYNRKDNTITYNISLALCDYELIDYVIIHELCHLKYSGHQKDFHEMLETHCPNHRYMSKKLKKEYKEIC